MKNIVLLGSTGSIGSPDAGRYRAKPWAGRICIGCQRGAGWTSWKTKFENIVRPLPSWPRGGIQEAETTLSPVSLRGLLWEYRGLLEAVSMEAELVVTALVGMIRAGPPVRGDPVRQDAWPTRFPWCAQAKTYPEVGETRRGSPAGGQQAAPSVPRRKPASSVSSIILAAALGGPSGKEERTI